MDQGSAVGPLHFVATPCDVTGVLNRTKRKVLQKVVVIKVKVIAYADDVSPIILDNRKEDLQLGIDAMQ